MEDTTSHSPPPAPDPAPATQQQPKVQAFQEPFVAPSAQSPTLPQLEQQRATPSRSRASSINKSVVHQPQPIRDAVDRAFGQSQPPNTLDPAFIAQVTEAVVKNLQNATLNPLAPPAAQTAQYPPPPSVHSVPQSPTHSSTASLPSRYTPPSPERGRDRGETGSHANISPGPLLSENDSTLRKGGNDGSKLNDRDDDTPKPAFGDTAVGARVNESIREVQEAQDLSRAEEGRASSTNSRRRDSRDSVASQDGPKSRVPPRVPSPLAEATTLERIWQPLFDKGIPTLRLSQFLRGIALQLIEEYEPKGSLVVTPPKMLRFFEQTKIEDELYPWHLIFGGGMVSASISVMFRRLKCEHHLVQTHNQEAPNVPALTPLGFETFLTCLIQAHPDLEFERLSKAVMNMPISNADYRTERFPKELSRRLLPAQPNPIVEQCIIASMAHEASTLHLRNSNAMPPPPTSAPPQQSYPERERQPYSQSSYSNEVNDDDLEDFVPSVPIERERKPYYAKEGTGKMFADSSRDDSPGMNPGRPTDPAHMPPPPRASYNDYSAHSQAPNGASSDPRAIPHTKRHRNSASQGVPPNGQIPGTSYPKGRRSPPPSAAYVRSDPVNLGEIPPGQYASNLHNPRPVSHFERDQFDDGQYNYPNRRTTASAGVGNQFDEGGKPIPSRSNQPPPPTASNGFDSAYGSAASGSYPGPRARNYDDRRRSMYGGPPPSLNSGGGSDGWGSFANTNGAPGMYPPPQQGYGNPGTQH
ncbi:hypothetical protein Q7P37_004612 [Cladosporium fusiforme]